MIKDAGMKVCKNGYSLGSKIIFKRKPSSAGEFSLKTTSKWLTHKNGRLKTQFYRVQI
jgi:hypothetical protein